MKKIVLLFFTIPIFMNAQNDSVYSLATKYVDNFIKTNNLNKNYFIKQDSIFFEKVLNYIETFKTDTNYIRITRGIQIVRMFALYEYLPQYLIFYNKPIADTQYNAKKTLKIRQRAVNFILDVYNYPGIRGSGTGLWMFDSVDFDQQARQKIAFLLAGNISDSDFERHKTIFKKTLKYGNSIIYNYGNKRTILENEIKRTGNPDSLVRDSLYKVWTERDLKNFKLPKIYNIELLHVIGRNYMYEFEPQIKSLMDTVAGVPVYFCKLILARFGREPYLTDFFNSVNKYEFIPDIDYIIEQILFVCNNPRSFDILENWIDTKKYRVEPAISYGTTGTSPYKSIKGGYLVCYYIANLVIGFPTQYKDFPEKYKYNIDAIDFTKEWIKQNMDKIELDTKFYNEILPFEYNYIDISTEEFKKEYQIQLEFSNKFSDK